MWDKLEVTYKGTTKMKMLKPCSRDSVKLSANSNHLEWCIQMDYQLKNLLEVFPKLGKLKLPFLKMEICRKWHTMNFEAT
ncbi:hypothetical protein KY290_010580 [Solanum tuberosum]|uniref:Uncharacterized protein n=1 Tax=Solanum tuberosum TaxID=4113 RepID=A0ABQ7W067_SOLTU|nr:hypothetical protein KY290_010580 [Solanum tuberosum]